MVTSKATGCQNSKLPKLPKSGQKIDNWKWPKVAKKIPTSAQRCLKLQKMSKVARVAKICQKVQKLQKHDKSCQKMPIVVRNCGKLPKIAKMWQKVPKCGKKCNNVAKVTKMWQKWLKFWKVPKSCTSCQKMPKIKFNLLIPKVAKFAKSEKFLKVAKIWKQLTKVAKRYQKL